MGSLTCLSHAFTTASISLCTKKRWAQTFWGQQRQSATFIKVQKFSCPYLLRKIAFAAQSSCRESAAEEFCGRRSQEVTCFTRQPTARPPTRRNSPLSAKPYAVNKQLQSTTATMWDEDLAQEWTEDRTWSVWVDLLLLDAPQRRRKPFMNESRKCLVVFALTQQTVEGALPTTDQPATFQDIHAISSKVKRQKECRAVSGQWEWTECVLIQTRMYCHALVSQNLLTSAVDMFSWGTVINVQSTHSDMHLFWVALWLHDCSMLKLKAFSPASDLMQYVLKITEGLCLKWNAAHSQVFQFCQTEIVWHF